LAPWTLNSILKQAGPKGEEFHAIRDCILLNQASEYAALLLAPDKLLDQAKLFLELFRFGNLVAAIFSQSLRCAVALDQRCKCQTMGQAATNSSAQPALSADAAKPRG
jgi:hypothetical protein